MAPSKATKSKPKALLSWSSGKDSAWALHVLRARGEFDIVGLMTTLNAEFDRVAMHAVRRELLVRQAEAVNLPLFTIPLPWPCTNETCESLIAKFLFDIRHTEQITHVAFGDLFLEDVRIYRERQMADAGLTPVFPIWGLPTHDLSRQMVKEGLKARLTCVDPRRLPCTFAGCEYDTALLEELPAGVDPCGEAGEFHTFAYEGPMFSRPLKIAAGAVVERDGFCFADILLAADST